MAKVETSKKVSVKKLKAEKKENSFIFYCIYCIVAHFFRLKSKIVKKNKIQNKTLILQIIFVFILNFTIIIH